MFTAKLSIIFGRSPVHIDNLYYIDSFYFIDKMESMLNTVQSDGGALKGSVQNRSRMHGRASLLLIELPFNGDLLLEAQSVHRANFDRTAFGSARNCSTSRQAAAGKVSAIAAGRLYHVSKSTGIDGLVRSRAQRQRIAAQPLLHGCSL